LTVLWPDPAVLSSFSLKKGVDVVLSEAASDVGSLTAGSCCRVMMIGMNADLWPVPAA
jgi:hypothetical protein